MADRMAGGPGSSITITGSDLDHQAWVISYRVLLSNHTASLFFLFDHTAGLVANDI